MNLYEINERISGLLEGSVDEETGELLTDFSELDALLMERDEKRENIACWIVNMRSEADAIKAQEKVLYDRRKALEKKLDSVTEYLRETSHGEELRTARVSVTFRKNPQSVSITDENRFLDWAMAHGDTFLRYKAPDIDKTAVKKQLQAGGIIPGAELEQKITMVVK